MWIIKKSEEQSNSDGKDLEDGSEADSDSDASDSDSSPATQNETKDQSTDAPSAEFQGTPLKFRDQHPQHQSHHVLALNTPVVPELTGGRIPDRASLSNEEAAEKRQYYAMFALSLFRSWRTAQDLCAEGDWWKSYLVWKEHPNALSTRILDNMQEYYESRRRGLQSTATSPEIGGSPEQSTQGSIPTRADTMDVTAATECAEAVMLERMEEREGGRGILVHSSSTEIDEPTACALLASRVLPMCLYPIPLDCANMISHTATHVRNWKTAMALPTNETKDQEEQAQVPAESDEHNPFRQQLADATIPSRAHWLYFALTDGQQHSTTFAASPEFCALMHRPPSLREISQEFTLNDLQHKAFVVLGTIVLRKVWAWLKRDCSQPLIPPELIAAIENLLPPTQVLFALCGGGGCGKSHCIRAAQELGRRWGFPNAVILTALTGAAATILGPGSSTVHSLMGLSPTQPNRRLSATAKQAKADRLAASAVLVIDEISMCSKRLLGEISRSLKCITGSARSYMGGIDVCFAGDFMQLPPVLASALYTKLDQKGSATPSEDEIAGATIWQEKVQHAIVLQQNQRALADPAFAALLSNIRNGKPTQRDVDVLNTRLMRGFGGTAACPVQHVPIVVSENKARHALNIAGIACLSTLENPATLLRMQVRSSDSAVRLSSDLENMVRRLNSKHLKGVQNELLIMKGMRVSITCNISVSKHGVANGTEGVVVDIVHDTKTTFTPAAMRLSFGCTANARQMNPPREFPIMVPSQLPLAILVKVDGASFQLDDLPVGVFPIFPIKPSIRVRIPGRQQHFNVIVESFPITPMFACTGHKVQGKSMSKLIVGNVDTKMRGWLYVVLSRARTLDGLYLMERITLHALKQAAPTSAQRQELDRLQAIHVSTVAIQQQFQATWTAPPHPIPETVTSEIHLPALGDPTADVEMTEVHPESHGLALGDSFQQPPEEFCELSSPTTTVALSTNETARRRQRSASPPSRNVRPQLTALPADVHDTHTRALSEHEYQILNSGWDASVPNCTVVAKWSVISVDAEGFRRLLPGGWLNNDVSLRYLPIFCFVFLTIHIFFSFLISFHVKHTNTFCLRFKLLCDICVEIYRR
jgi:hypothetical protein